MAVNKQTGELTVGVDTYKPSVRKSSTILQPIRPTNKVDKVNISLFVNAVPVSILYKSISDRYRPVRVADGPIMARY